MKTLYSLMVLVMLPGCAEQTIIIKPANLEVPKPLEPIPFRWKALEDGSAVMVDPEGFGRIYHGLSDRNISYEYCREIIKINNRKANETDQ
jgi:hypothetical protein